jgi:hypothetical protein
METCCEEAGFTGDERDSCVASPSSDVRACQSECREGKALDHCELRRADAVESSQVAYTEDAIRWACADVEGVNTNGNDDRGQEYCEYYAVLQPPPATDGGELPDPLVLGRKTSNSSNTPLDPEFTEDQLFALEDEFDSVVGQCVFTSWHQDIQVPYPVCDGGSCPDLSIPDDVAMASYMSSGDLGVPLNDEMMRMKVTINSNGAASDLLEKCFQTAAGGDELDPMDPLHDSYTRGCMKAFQLFTTEWRRSDPTICTAAVRLQECGCGVDADGDGVADLEIDPTDFNSRIAVATALVPPQPQDGEVTLRGFKLGTWSDPKGLPSGCRYVDTGDDSQTLVSCDITASDVLSSPNDPKEICRQKYGDNVVVHIPVPSGAVVCNPPEGAQYGETCGDLVPFAAPDTM